MTTLTAYGEREIVLRRLLHRLIHGSAHSFLARPRFRSRLASRKRYGGFVLWVFGSKVWEPRRVKPAGFTVSGSRDRLRARSGGEQFFPVEILAVG